MAVWVIVILLALAALIAAAVNYFVRFAVAREGFKDGALEDNPTWGKFAPTILSAEKTVQTWPQKDVRCVSSQDGISLHAVWYPTEQARGTVVLVHGFRGQALRDFCWVMPFYRALGLNILLPDQRAHGESGGAYICFGVKERCDVADWLAWLDTSGTPRLPVFLNGVSMGGAAVLMASGLPLRGDVRGIIADCGYTSPEAIMRHVCRTMFHLPAFPLLPLCGAVIHRRAGFRLNECSTLAAMKTNTLPILFIHGTADTFVPPDMTRQNYAACTTEKELLLIEGATHAVSGLTDAPRCEAAVKAFIDKHLGEEHHGEDHSGTVQGAQ